MIKVFDGHSDIFEDVYEKRIRGMHDVIDKVHAPKWQNGNCKGGFYPIWVDPFCDIYNIPVEKQFVEMCSQMEEELKHNTSSIAVGNYEEYLKAINEGKHAIILGTEGLSFLHGDYEKLEDLYNKKFRIFSLTWNEENEFACGASCQIDKGLSKNGVKAVKKIGELGAIFDLAHSNRKTFFDSIKLLDKPFVVSHGNVDKLNPHPRNFTDDQLKAIYEFNGVIGISAYPPFISSNKEKHTIKGFSENVAYVADKIGVSHVGLGFDFVDFLDDYGVDESISYSLKNLEGIHQAQNLVDELSKIGFNNEEIELIFSKNFERVIKEVL